MDIFSTILKLGAVLVLVLLNGFFVAAEFAIVKVRATQIEPLVKAGVRKAKIAQRVITHLDTFLSATQLGITMTSLALGWVGEPFVATLLMPVMELIGIDQQALIHTISFALAFSFITFLHIVLGELAPKSLAIQWPKRTTLRVARPMYLFFVVFRPFIWVLNSAANAILRVFGIRPAGETEIAHSEEELRLLLSRQKAITSVGRAISLNAISLRDRTVREVMVPRTSVVYLDVDNSIEQNIAVAMENQFTRYPLCQEHLDNVLGMIHLKDLFKMKGAQGSGSKLLEIKREMLFVPETTPLEVILNTFLTKRMLMAIAVDEYGGTAGLVTLENVLEELVGEIRDEFDVEPAMVQKLTDGEFLVDGTMPLHEFSRMFDVVPESHDVVTVSGYAIHLLGRVPEKGAQVRIGRWKGTVDAIAGKRVKTLRLTRIPEEVVGKRGGAA